VHLVSNDVRQKPPFMFRDHWSGTTKATWTCLELSINLSCPIAETSFDQAVNITILTYGSRGDIQPFLSLSLGLMRNGHSVKLAAPSRFQNLIEGYGIPFVTLAGDPEDLSRRFNNAGYNFVKQMREMMDHAITIGADVARQTAKACEGADLIVHTFSHLVGAHTLAREMNVPDVHIQTFPMFSPTGDYPNVTLPDLKVRAEPPDIWHHNGLPGGLRFMDMNKSAARRLPGGNFVPLTNSLARPPRSCAERASPAAIGRKRACDGCCF
jgi:hypothetical protein